MPRCDPCNRTFPTTQGAQAHYTLVHLKGHESDGGASDTSSENDSSDWEHSSSGDHGEVNPGSIDAAPSGSAYTLDDIVGYPVSSTEDFDGSTTGPDEAGGGSGSGSSGDGSSGDGSSDVVPGISPPCDGLDDRVVALSHV